MSLSIAEAVKLTGVSRTTILRALKNGKISGSKNDDGIWMIKPVDLMQHYSVDPSKIEEAVQAAHPAHVRSSVRGAPRTPLDEQVNTTEIRVLQVELEAAKQLAEEYQRSRARSEDTNADLRARLDRAEELREEATARLTAYLTHQHDVKPSPEEKPAAEAPVPVTQPARRPRPVFVWVALIPAVVVAGTWYLREPLATFIAALSSEPPSLEGR